MNDPIEPYELEHIDNFFRRLLKEFMEEKNKVKLIGIPKKKTKVIGIHNNRKITIEEDKQAEDLRSTKERSHKIDLSKLFIAISKMYAILRQISPNYTVVIESLPTMRWDNERSLQIISVKGHLISLDNGKKHVPNQTDLLHQMEENGFYLECS